MSHEACWHWIGVGEGKILCCHCLHEKTYPIAEKSEVWEVLRKPVHHPKKLREFKGKHE